MKEKKDVCALVKQEELPCRRLEVGIEEHAHSLDEEARLNHNSGCD